MLWNGQQQPNLCWGLKGYLQLEATDCERERRGRRAVLFAAKVKQLGDVYSQGADPPLCGAECRERRSMLADESARKCGGAGGGVDLPSRPLRCAAAGSSSGKGRKKRAVWISPRRRRAAPSPEPPEPPPPPPPSPAGRGGVGVAIRPQAHAMCPRRPSRARLPLKNHSFITLSHFTLNFVMRDDTIPLTICSYLPS